ncbi:MAG TPA: amidohydrolase family protein [Gemmatimonadaceae bacterium]|nr:amidohydrolase family protein [Gemmatimonadaceae bacterium]
MKPALRLVTLTLMAVARAGAQPALPPPQLPADVPPSANVYVQFVRGNPRALQAVWRDSAGTMHTRFMQDNPRCQIRVSSTYRLDADGIPTHLELEGTVCPGAVAIRERFDLTRGHATWSNRIENVDTTVTGKRFYLTVIDHPEETALLARALLKAGGTIRLLPDGEARIERVQQLTVRRGAETQTVTQYRISGVDYGSRNVWLDEQQQLFAAWTDIIRRGWESTRDTLLAAQRAAAAQREATIERNAVRRPGTALVIHSARLFDANTATTRDNVTVTVSGNRIVSVAQTQAADKRVAGAIDATGMTLLPGLWDAHGHGLGASRQYIAAGVTTIRVLAASHDMPRAHWEPIETGDVIEPRIVPIAIIDGPQVTVRQGARVQTAADSIMIVRTADDVRRFAQRFADEGYRQLKMYDSLDPTLVPVMITSAHELGMRTSGHIPLGVTPQDAIAAGLDEVHHMFALMNGLVPNLDRSHDVIQLALRAGEIDLDSPAVKSMIASLRERHVTVDPTAVAFEQRLTNQVGKAPGHVAPYFAQIPVQEQRRLLASLEGTAFDTIGGPNARERKRKSFDKLLELMRMISDAGVTVLPGTDVPTNGFALLRELELHVQAGIPASRVLQAATLGAARTMKLDAQIGTVDAGKLADLVLVDGNPTRNISDIRRTRFVIKDGVVIDARALWVSIGLTPIPSPRTR